jgi:hypothetical protein
VKREFIKKLLDAFHLLEEKVLYSGFPIELGMTGGVGNDRRRRE